MGVSQSPKPQSKETLARAGWRQTSSLTRAKLLCDTTTISCTSSGSWLGKSARMTSADAAAGMRVEAAARNERRETRGECVMRVSMPVTVAPGNRRSLNFV